MLDDLLLFIEVANRSSFSKTAEDLSLNPATLSKRISALEEQMGQTMLVRSSRGVTLTTFGQNVFEQFAQPIQDLKQSLDTHDNFVARELRVLCPLNLIVGPLFDVVKAFKVTHPQVTLSMQPDNANSLLSQKRFDLTVRVGDQNDSGLFQKRLGEIAVAIVGTQTSTTLFCPYQNKHLPQTVKTEEVASNFEQVNYVGDITLARKLVAGGLGSAILPMTEIDALMESPELEFSYQSPVLFVRPIYALWANSRVPSANAKQFIDLALHHCSNTHYLHGGCVELNGDISMPLKNSVFDANQ